MGPHRETRLTQRDEAAAARAAAHEITGSGADYTALLDALGSQRVVLIGEASHGTRDFYAERARLTRLLIEQQGFDAVAAEADWPDSHRLDRFARGEPGDDDADAALGAFRRFPTWMWRNTEVRDFVVWLRRHNAQRASLARGGRTSGPVRFFGLDLYSMRASMASVVSYLEAVDKDAARRARGRYACFDHVGDHAHYGPAVVSGDADPCADEAVAQLVELRRRAAELLSHDGIAAEDEHFVAVQNAVVVRDAEEYYREMYAGEQSSWNLRERHMSATLEALVEHLSRQTGRPARVVVWAHNSHVGDVRATSMAARGRLTLGQLARQRYGDDAALVGMTTYDGEVTAAPDWGRPVRRWRVRPALRWSQEEMLHDVGIPRFWLATDDPALGPALLQERLERAIGVVYRPIHERQSHYYLARLREQYDAVIHLDRTAALEPLDLTEAWERGEPPETYPSGL